MDRLDPLRETRGQQDHALALLLNVTDLHEALGGPLRVALHPTEPLERRDGVEWVELDALDDRAEVFPRDQLDHQDVRVFEPHDHDVLIRV